MIITIDGPTASGKTTVARLLARKLSFYYLSSGILYRGLAYALMHSKKYNEHQLHNPLAHDIEQMLALDRFVYQFTTQEGEKLFFDDVDITPFLKTVTISAYSSIIATNKSVRDALEKLQHRIADHHNLVAEGRDTGSVIFPQANVKFFLTASLEVRAARWQADQKAKGHIISESQAKHEVESRDARDMNRALAPLCIPQDAIIIDDSNLSQEDVVHKMMEIINQINN